MKKVSVIITTYLPESKKYLDLCIRSIENLDYPKEDLEVIVVGKPDYLPQYKSAKTICPPQETFHNAVGLNCGVKNASDKSDFLFILNDDVILTKNCLKPMIEMNIGNNFIINGISPCDNNVQYILTFGFKTKNDLNILTSNHYSYEQFEPYFDDVMNADSLYSMGFIKQEFLCMYATLYPRKVFQDVGLFDEKIKTGPDDIDYSWRAIEKGYACGASLSSLIWHFGGVSVEKSQTTQRRVDNLRYFLKKWNKLPAGMDVALARMEKELKGEI